MDILLRKYRGSFLKATITIICPFLSLLPVPLHLQGICEYFCDQVMPLKNYQELLSAYWTVGHHPNINEICEIILDSKHAYVIFRRHFEDLHSYIRRLRRLRESEAAAIFHQIVCAVKHCHRNGVVLRDLKLRKFVFMDADRYGIDSILTTS